MNGYSRNVKARSRGSARAQRFWSQFGYVSATVVDEFTNTLQESTEQVVMFTSRKAACFGDSLRLVQSWTPHSEIVSDKCLDLDTSWLDSKSLLLVDDVIATGQTLDRILTALAVIPLRSVRVLPVATRVEWSSAVEALQSRHPEVEFVRPTAISRGTSALPEEIVRAIAAVPRPYNLDWPLMSGWRATSQELDALISTSGWDSRETTSKPQSHLGIRTFSLEPIARQQSVFLNWMNAPDANVGLLKIRLYFEPIEKGKWNVALMPIMAFDRIPLSSLETFSKSVGLPKTIENGASQEGLLRIGQYLASRRVAQQFERSVAPLVDGQTLAESRWQLSLGFGPALSEVAQDNDMQQTVHEFTPPKALRRQPRPARDAVEWATMSRRAEFDLSNFLWRQSKSGERILARKSVEGSPAEELSQFFDNMWPQPSFTVAELIKVLNDSGFGPNAPTLVSRYLDNAIDYGLTVPVVRRKGAAFERAFRAGETIYFSLREQRLFYTLIEHVLDSAPSVDIGKILLEKILVLAMRFGVQTPGLMTPLSFPSSDSVLTIAYSRYGSIATPDPNVQELPLAGSTTHTLGRELDDLGIIGWRKLQNAGPERYAVEIGPDELSHLQGQYESPFQRLGFLIGSILTNTKLSRLDFQLFVVLCNAPQIPLALGSEVRSVAAGLRSVRIYVRDGGNAKNLGSKVSGTSDWVLCLLSAIEKLDGLARDVVNTVDEQLRRELPTKDAIDWREVADSVIVPEQSVASAEVVRSLSAWLIRSAILVSDLRKQYRKDTGRQFKSIDIPNLESIGARLLGGETTGRLIATSTQSLESRITDLCNEADWLLEEVSVLQDSAASRNPPVRYVQAILVHSQGAITTEGRQALDEALGLLEHKHRVATQTLPPVVTGWNSAGWAVQSHVNVRSVAEQVIPYLLDADCLRDTTVYVIENLGVAMRLIRREFDSYWIGAGFTRLAKDLPDVSRAVSRVCLVHPLGGVER